MALTQVQYLKRELNFTSKEYMELSIQDKADLKEWAKAEMKIRNIG